eukprot:m.8616 g.8616  ORF g.8616 m.8616 type:complete len:376 (-) comp6156_c0_seq2:220-1347(-)
MDYVFDFATDVVVYVPTVFRASAIAILFLYGWTLNVKGFDDCNIPFRRILGLSPDDVQFQQLIHGVHSLTATLIICYFIHEVCFLNSFDVGVSLAQIAFWVLLLGQCLFSSQPLFRGFRSFVSARIRTFFQFLEVNFVDVLVGDALTSMSKLLADMTVVVCSIFSVMSGSYGKYQGKCLHSVVSPSLASIPYCVRAIQCFNLYSRHRRHKDLLNMFKYLSAFPVIWISALKHNQTQVEGVTPDHHDKALQVLWLYSVSVNTVYSFLWDVLMDWGLCHETDAPHVLLRKTLLFEKAWKYYMAIVLDLALRFCWSLKLSSHLQHHATGLAFVFLFEVLEVFRRFVWNYFRIEWEYVKELNSQRGSFITSQPLTLSKQ